ncbi:MAG: hotdog fold thioesterase [Pseudomonadota bacterium]
MSDAVFDPSTAPPQGSDPADVRARAIAEYMLSKEGTGPHWGIEIEVANVGYCRLGMRLTPTMLNGLNIAHGAMVFAIADTAFAYACNARNQASVAFQTSMTFIAAGQASERLIAEARERHQGSRTGIYDMNVYGEDGRMIAAFTGTSRTLGHPTMPEGT